MKQRHSIWSMKRIQTVVEICAWKYYVEGEILIRGIQWTSYFFLLFILLRLTVLWVACFV